VLRVVLASPRAGWRGRTRTAHHIKTVAAIKAGRCAAGTGARRPDGFARSVSPSRVTTRVRGRNTGGLQIVGPSAPGRAAPRPDPPAPRAVLMRRSPGWTSLRRCDLPPTAGALPGCGAREGAESGGAQADLRASPAPLAAIGALGCYFRQGSHGLSPMAT